MGKFAGHRPTFYHCAMQPTMMMMMMMMMMRDAGILQEIVDLIENLESACIRFVHFSKENELRSRVRQ